MKENSLKEYSILAMMSKEEQKVLKTFRRTSFESGTEDNIYHVLFT